MLYVFQVDHGKIMKFDTRYAMESVGYLKNHIHTMYDIESEKQVFLTSSGEVLENNTSICSHPVGTETNPIFLYSKKLINESIMPKDTIPALDLKEQEMIKTIRIHLKMPGNFPTVSKRAQLAQELIDVARNHLSECQRLVHEQHLQQQGWKAVSSNLEDIVVDFEKRIKIFIKSFALFIRDRDYYLGFLKDYQNDLSNLEKIPVLNALLKASSSQDTEAEEEVDLYHWILTTDNKSIIDQLYQICSWGLKEFDGPKYVQLTTEIQEFLDPSNKNKHKEVEGLNERLSSLDALLIDLKGLVGQQSDFAQAFENNKMRASTTKDASVLPDLCLTHHEQLQMMEKIHIQICDILRRCMKSKHELTRNLYSRFNWVTSRQDRICDLYSKVMVQQENFKRVQRHLKVLRQIHVAPSTYVFAVSEVVRRRKFSQSFLKLANELACHFLNIYKEEIMRRKQFRMEFKGHFLNTLFPGMDDLPRPFATQAPSVFDASLPRITEEDVDWLKQKLPYLSKKLKVPDLPTDFRLIDDLVRKGDEKEEVLNVNEAKAVIEERVEAVAVSDIKLASDLDGSLLKDGFDRECVSESGSEDFENVFQSSVPSIVTTSTLPHTQDASTITEVGERSPIPYRKPPITFQKSHRISLEEHFPSNLSAGNTDSFANPENASLDSVPSDSCFNSHHQQLQGHVNMRQKSVSPQSPKDIQANSPKSPFLGHQPTYDFVSDEFYIDESLPSSLSIETGQSQGEFVKQLDTANNVISLLQDNLEIFRSENDRLKSLLLRLYQLAKEETSQLKNEIGGLRSTILSNKDLMSQECKSLGSSWENVMVERDSKEREKLEMTRKCHQEAMDNLRRQDQEKTKKVEQLSCEKLSLESEVLKSCQDLRELRENIERINEDKVKTMHELQNRIREVEEEKEKSIKEVTDKLNIDHKAEIERIKRHFKLMTMERSPSDANLDKSGDFASLPASMFLQIKENFELDKEKAVNEALLAEREKWKKLLDITVRDTEARCLQDAGIFQNDYREREFEAKKQIIEYLNKIAILEREIEQLKCEYMVTSEYEGKVDATTSPIKQKELRSEIPLSRSGKVSIDSCKPGDLVVVVWEPAHESFKIIQENKHMFFLHSDYLEGLGLEIVNGEPNKSYIIGEVVDKEYCFARKSENRYKVPKRTKFFRVKVKPYASAASSKNVTQSLYQPKPAEVDAPRMTLSQHINVISEDDSIPFSLPSSPTNTHPTIMERDDPDTTITSGDVASNLDRSKVQEVESVETTFAEDSGIVENVEEAMAILDTTLTSESRNESESSDR